MRPTLVRTAKLAAGSCFDENTALDLVEGHMSEARKEAVLAHAESCESCRRLLADLTALEEPPAPEPGADTKAPEHVGPWKLDHCVGSGAAGTVYRAHHRQTGQLAAVKLVYDPTMRVRFEREARALASLDHPGIVRYLEHGALDDGTMFLVMQWLDGHDLAHHPTGLDATAVLDLGTRLSSALAHAHERGCVHRDLSPKNVFLPGGRVQNAMILDFGLVRWVRPDVSQTASQAIVGTPYYMAPEQIRGVFDIDARADLFALGVLLYQAAAGRLPFEGDDLLTVWQRIVHAQHPDLGRQAPHLPRAFVDLVGHLLEKAPSDRPASAQAVWHRLEAIRAGQPDVVKPRLAWFAFAALGVLGLGTAGWFSLYSTHDTATSIGIAGRRTPEPAVVAPAQVPAKGHPFACLGGTRTETGQHYSADPSPEPLEYSLPAVRVMGGCHVTLKDCVIDGPMSVHALGGTLTLERCKVEGDIQVFPGGTVRLLHDELAVQPEKMGSDARVTWE